MAVRREQSSEESAGLAASNVLGGGHPRSEMTGSVLRTVLPSYPCRLPECGFFFFFLKRAIPLISQQERNSRRSIKEVKLLSGPILRSGFVHLSS